LQGCFPFFLIKPSYPGKHPELFTVAIHSLIVARGFSVSGPPAGIRILEEDDYGRILFYHSEGVYNNHRLIAQKSDNTYVYYYPDFNFISTDFRQKTMELKEKNDWNRPLDKSKLIKQRIVKKKARYRLSRNNGEKIYREATGYNGNTRIFRESRYITSDKYGKKMLFTCGRIPGSEWICLLVIINADGSCDLATCFTRLTESFHYQHELKAFKELNGWSEPWAYPELR
jgi:hypothetical protein